MLQFLSRLSTGLGQPVELGGVVRDEHRRPHAQRAQHVRGHVVAPQVIVEAQQAVGVHRVGPRYAG